MTSEPVPQVVGTAATGKCGAFGIGVYKKSLSNLLFAISKAIAFEASRGEPPPIPMTKSTISEAPYCAPAITLSTDGFSSILSKTTYGILWVASAAVTSSSEPFLREELRPVTMSTFVPSAQSSFECAKTQLFSWYNLVEMSKFIISPFHLNAFINSIIQLAAFVNTPDDVQQKLILY